MEPMLILNTLPDRETFEEIALLKQISASFVEKDWYVTQVIGALAGLHHEDFELIFSGGTALSKAHRLLQRFSEDVDFRVIAPEGMQSRKILSNFKNATLKCLRDVGFSIADEQVKARDSNRFFAAYIDYETLFSKSDALRPHIQIEIAVRAPQLSPVYLPVASFVTEVSGQEPEVPRIGCTEPVENAADKLSALTWRIPDRVRGDQYDDPSIVRHIHDLAILKDCALTYEKFPTLVIESMKRDDNRSKNNPDFAGLPPEEKTAQMLTILESDDIYRGEYDRFVKGVSYAPESNIPDFDTAVTALKALVDKVLQTKI